MGVLTRVLRKAFLQGEVPMPTSSPLWYNNLSNNSKYNVGDGSGSSIVGAVLNWMIRQFGEADLRVYDMVKGQLEVLENHDLVNSIERPNEFYDGATLFAGTIASYVIDGNAYWVKVRNGASRVVGYWYIPHFLIEPYGDETTFIKYYIYNVNGRRFDIAPSEIVRFPFGIDPSNPRKGRSPLKEQLLELYTDAEAARFSAAMLTNLGVPGMVVAPKGNDAELTREEARVVKSEFDQTFGGDRRGSTIVMTGETEVQQLGFSPAEMDLRSLRALPEERVTAALGIPAAVIGLGTGLSNTKVGATMAEFREMATEQNLIPTWRSFAKTITRDILPEFRTARTQVVQFDTSKVRVLQPDRQLLHARTQDDVRAGILDVATAQGILGHPVDEAQRVYLRSPLTVEVPVATNPKGRSGEPETKARASSEEIAAGLAFVQFVERGTVRIMKQFEDVLTEAFDILGAEAAQLYLNSPKATPADSRIVNIILDDLNLDRQAEVRFQPMYGATYEATSRIVIEGVESMLGSSLAIGVRDTIAERVLAEGGTRVGLLDLTNQTRDALFRTLEDARARGLGIPDTARLIRDNVGAGRYVNAGARYRAETIARTEMRHARNISVAETGRAAGFDQYIAFDDRTGFGDFVCATRNGELVSASDMMSIDAEEHPRGTLSFSPMPRETPIGGGGGDAPLLEQQYSSADDWLSRTRVTDGLSPRMERLVREGISKLPPSHLGHVEKFVRGTRRESVLGTFDTNRILTLTDGAKRHTVVHEMAHSVDTALRASERGGRIYRVLDEERLRLLDLTSSAAGKHPLLFDEYARRRGAPSGYALTNAREFFAETYRVYVEKGAWLRSHNRTLYNTMHDLFGEVEYL